MPGLFSSNKLSDETRGAITQNLREMGTYLACLSEDAMSAELAEARSIFARQEAAIASARKILRKGREIWPSGNDFYEQMGLYLNSMDDLRSNFVEWKTFLEMEYLKQKTPSRGSAERYQHFVQKGRKIGLTADKHLADASRILKKATGLSLV